MSKSTDRNLRPDIPGTNPSVNPQTGAINPSAPTVGTEQWGTHEDDSSQADLSTRTSASAFSMHTSHGGGDFSFRGADVDNSDYRWETSADTEDEVTRHVEEHSRRDHRGMSDWSEAVRNQARNKVRKNIHRREAA